MLGMGQLGGGSVTAFSSEPKQEKPLLNPYGRPLLRQQIAFLNVDPIPDLGSLPVLALDTALSLRGCGKLFCLTLPGQQSRPWCGADLDHGEFSLDNRIIPPAKGKPSVGVPAVPGAAAGRRCLPSKCHAGLRGN